MIKQLSFLFFYVFTFCLGHPAPVQAQKATDSISYYYKLAMNPSYSNHLDAAYDFFSRYKTSCLQNKYIEGAVHALSILAIIQNESGAYHDSESSVIEALGLLETLNPSDYTRETKITLYNQLGKISRALKENERALSYYNKAFELATEPKQFNKIINNRAFIHMDNKNYAKALQDFQWAYDISIKSDDEREMARNLDNLGFVKSKLKHEDALIKLQSALNKRKTLNDVEGIYASYMHLYDHYKDQDDQINAMLNLKSALATANTLDSDSYRLDALSKYVDLDTDTLVMAYKTLNDKLILANLLNENKNASKKYDYTIKELEAERSKSQKTYYQLAAAAITAVLLLFILFLRTKHKKDRIEQVIRTETHISKKIHDELANDVSNIMNVIQSGEELTETYKFKVLDALQDVYVRTRNISTETAGIDFENYAESIKYLLVQHNKEHVRVVINGLDTVDWKQIHKHKKLAIYRTLQELMVNMKKHSNAQLVSVVFKKQNKKHEIRYTDDGEGSDFEKIHTNGLKNAEYRMKEAGGHLTFETSKGHGFKATITFNS